MTDIPTLDTIIHAHGHTCPGIAIGYKIAVEAAKWSGSETDIKVYSNTTRCPLDALKTTFSLREKPENLIVEDKNVLHLELTRPDGHKMIVDEVPGSKIKNPQTDELKTKIHQGTATKEEIALHDKLNAELVQKTLEMPNEKLFEIRFE